MPGEMASDQTPINDKKRGKEMAAVWLKPAYWASSPSFKILLQWHDPVAVQKKNVNSQLTQKYSVSQFPKWFHFFFTVMSAYLSP